MRYLYQLYFLYGICVEISISWLNIRLDTDDCVNGRFTGFCNGKPGQHLVVETRLYAHFHHCDTAFADCDRRNLLAACAKLGRSGSGNRKSLWPNNIHGALLDRDLSKSKHVIWIGAFRFRWRIGDSNCVPLWSDAGCVHICYHRKAYYDEYRFLAIRGSLLPSIYGQSLNNARFLSNQIRLLSVISKSGTPPMSIPKIVVLMTCFNRKDTTLSCLDHLFVAAKEKCDLEVVLVDDGSSDGTADAVGSRHPRVTVVKGSGSLYWNGGMRLAWCTALDIPTDFFLWLNDDTHLRIDAIENLLKCYNEQHSRKSIIVGHTVDPDSGELSYGGYRVSERGISKLHFRRLRENEILCDTMNGNCVLFPASVTKDVGINSANYRHAFGDIDLGFRARRNGYNLIQLGTPVAKQARNSQYDRSVEKLDLQNWRFILFNPKGVPINEWLRFCRDHAGIVWPVNFILRYTKMLVKNII